LALLLELLFEQVFVGAFGHCLYLAGDLGFVHGFHTGFFRHELVHDLIGHYTDFNYKFGAKI
jgi:hypothetical protein